MQPTLCSNTLMCAHPLRAVWAETEQQRALNHKLHFCVHSYLLLKSLVKFWRLCMCLHICLSDCIDRLFSFICLPDFVHLFVICSCSHTSFFFFFFSMCVHMFIALWSSMQAFLMRLESAQHGSEPHLLAR